VWLSPEQRLKCPEEFTERVIQAGGVNKYDEPNFKFVWGQSEDAAIRAGGVWENPDLPGIEHYTGYRDVIIGGEAAWSLQQWMPAEFWGTPAQWYADNFDPSTGMQTLGEYPYKGRYTTVFQLVWHGEVNGKKVAEHMPLNAYLVDVVIPIIVAAKEITLLQKKAVIEEQKARREAAEVDQIEGSIRNAFPALGEIRSAAGLSCLSVVQKKVEEIERNWATGLEFFRNRKKGISVVN